MGKPAFLERKEDEVSLPIMVKSLTLKNGEPDYAAIRHRLESAYSNAVTQAMAQLKTEGATYDKQIREAMHSKNIPKAEQIRDSMPNYFDFDPQKQKVVLAVGVESGLRSIKPKFISSAMDVIKTCMFGKSTDEEEVVSSSSISFGKDAAIYAALLAPALAKQLGMEKPENTAEARVPFTAAKVAKGKFPLSIESQGDTISIAYAPWIAVANRTQIHEE